MSMLSIFNVSGSAASAQSQRLNVVASNLANVDTVAGPDGQAYKARQVTFQTQLMGESGERPERRPAYASAPSAKTRRRAGKCSRSGAPERRCRRLRHLQQRQRGRGDGQHDLGLAFVPEQPRGHEHGEIAAAQDHPARQLKENVHDRQRSDIHFNDVSNVNVDAPRQASASNSTVSADTFLKLLVAQMKNQDPLNPMDNAAGDEPDGADQHRHRHQYAEHLGAVAVGASSRSMQALQGASLVGHSVIVPGNMMSIDPTTAIGQGGFQIATPADAVKVDILAPSGAVVQTINLGAEACRHAQLQLAGRHGDQRQTATPSASARPAGGVEGAVDGADERHSSTLSRPRTAAPSTSSCRTPALVPYSERRRPQLIFTPLLKENIAMGFPARSFRSRTRRASQPRRHRQQHRQCQYLRRQKVVAGRVRRHVRERRSCRASSNARPASARDARRRGPAIHAGHDRDRPTTRSTSPSTAAASSR